jgi:hypothetical protein
LWSFKPTAGAGIDLAAFPNFYRIVIPAANVDPREVRSHGIVQFFGNSDEAAPVEKFHTLFFVSIGAY